VEKSYLQGPDPSYKQREHDGYTTESFRSRFVRDTDGRLEPQTRRLPQSQTLGRSLFELILTTAALGVCWGLGWLAWNFGHPALALIFTLPAGVFLVRLFMIQHDCGHGSFFEAKAANDRVGRAIGVLTLDPL